MLLTITANAPMAASVSPVWWGMTLVGLVLAGLIGFFMGQTRARSATRRAIDRAKSSIANLYGHVCQSVDEAQQACVWLENYPNLQLSVDQLQKLDGKRATFLDTMQHLVDSRLPPPEQPAEQSAEPPSISWVSEPESSVTKLPDRSAFDANLDLILRQGSDAGFQSAFLLVRMDKSEDLKSRFGIAGIQQFQQKMAGLICRSMRDADIVCQNAADTFAVLIPGVDEAKGKDQFETIRQAIRSHNFRLKGDGAEVLVTASFGGTLLREDDSPDLVLSRAENALKRSRKQGRNQLHVDTGTKLVACKST